MSEVPSEAAGAAPKAASLVAAHIRKQIVLGELSEGDLLPSEAEMVKRLGVSRPTLRQAFRILETEHLITVQRGSRGGTTVLRPSIQLASRYLSDLLRYQRATLGDVLAARLMIEPAAVAQLAARQDDAAVATLRELVAQQRATDNADKVAELAEQFHISLVELAGNPVLAQYSKLVHHLLRGHVRGSVAAAGPDRPALADVSPDPHSELVDLVAAGAAHAATEHWHKHLTTIEGRLAKLLDLNAALVAPTQ